MNYSLKKIEECARLLEAVMKEENRIMKETEKGYLEN